MRIALIISIVITASGCISADYKSGSYWVLEEQSPKVARTIDTQCANSKIHTNGSIASSSQIIAPYFIPLFYLSEKPDKKLIVTIDNQECPELSIKDHEGNSLPYTTESLKSKYCKIYIVQPKRTDKIIIQTMNSKSPCGSHTIPLIKKSFFCIRQTEFGGSPGCERAL